MALASELKQTIRWIDQAFEKYANDHGWSRDAYKVLVRVNRDWGQVHVILAAKEFPGKTDQEKWRSVMDYLVKEFEHVDPSLLKSVNLTLRTFEQIDQGGIYGINPKFVDVHEVLVGDHAD